MTFIGVTFCAILVCQVYARPQENSQTTTTPVTPTATNGNGGTGNVTFLKNEITPLDGKGSFSYDIELSDGTKFMQSGRTEAPEMGETEPSIVIEGSYAYVAPDGKMISISYVADKEGFKPKGDAIPTQGNAVGGMSSNSTTTGVSSTESPSKATSAPVTSA